ncbi:hypothetical protein [Herbiconiux liangxiaofengii]|uniref:hypothetical protein n=1 Tax=Herbiconiux liangxiaofengii TaxID=3342795 RepID=UPI0035B74C94
MLFIARGIEDDHYWVVQELDGALVETPWRVESVEHEMRWLIDECGTLLLAGHLLLVHHSPISL